jgi:hypothetical protein
LIGAFCRGDPDALGVGEGVSVDDGVTVGEGLGDGVAVKRGVGGRSGAGGGGGGGCSVTVRIGPKSGSGCVSPEVVAWKVTCQIPAGSVAAPCQIPSWAVPSTFVNETVTLPTCAQMAWAGRAGLSVDVYRTLNVNAVAVVPVVAVTAASVSADAASTGVGRLAIEARIRAAAKNLSGARPR